MRLRVADPAQAGEREDQSRGHEHPERDRPHGARIPADEKRDEHAHEERDVHVADRDHHPEAGAEGEQRPPVGALGRPQEQEGEERREQRVDRVLVRGLEDGVVEERRAEERDQEDGGPVRQVELAQDPPAEVEA